ncbi:hypothetical protein DU57_03225 [Methanosarcina mazei]|uniref:UDP-N-acetylglucosamine 2-epimerase domain-containing protein n=1 Tax=Methanosarcina mazei TaxID=2209 RepID=A0A0F8MWP5_METMZ|nr:UDP-N-acetylglucosamine 2-epimerase [Methanosarcina mazei]KKG87330.1 hypothetical protein DU59_06955 [Methanosarcina mazei]KKG89126.1 hypothetical protein DU57_03225 [Methanosarcina mazei]KKH09971.1 hypothetical protein DU42_05070 [Methanosarcina mazei]
MTLGVSSRKHREQTAKILARIEEILIKDRPDVMLVQGDTNAVLAGTLAVSKIQEKIDHTEAGLGAFDKTMLGETIRIIAGHTSDYFFAPTETPKRIF